MDSFGAVEGVVTLVVGLVFMVGGPLLYLYLQVMALRNWAGWWRLAAIPPLAGMGAATMATVAGLQEGANLAPLMFVLSAPVAAAWLAAVAFVRGRCFA